MPPITWLVIALIAGVAAYLVAWPSWQSYRARETRDVNAERYRAWRGNAPRPGSARTREGMTAEERRRVYGGVALTAVAAAALVAFFVAS